MDWKRYNSKKFAVTVLVVICGTMLAAYQRLDANSGLLLAAAIGSYNYMQGRIDEKNEN